MTASPTLTSTCPTWCSWQPERPCTGDHWASPGSEHWPGIVATAWGPRLEFAPAPTWAECDESAPAVILRVLERSDAENRVETDADLTLEEAEQLAAALLRAVEAVKAG